MRDQQHHPFPFPDPPSFQPEFPRVLPVDEPIWKLSSWWLEIHCRPCNRTSLYPFRLMSARIGWDVTLGHVVEHLRCPRCGTRPEYLAMVETAASGAGRHHDTGPARSISGALGVGRGSSESAPRTRCNRRDHIVTDLKESL